MVLDLEEGSTHAKGLTVLFSNSLAVNRKLTRR
jgi:hypothetical protein